MRTGTLAILLGALLAACDASSGGGSGGSGGGGGGGGGGGSDPYAAQRAACLSGLNAYRAQVGAPPLAAWTGAQACADGQIAQDLAAGTAHGAFGRCGEWAQNECMGFRDPDPVGRCLALMFAEGPENGDGAVHGHYVNMTNPAYTQVACGFARNAYGEWWEVQDFR